MYYWWFLVLFAIIGSSIAQMALQVNECFLIWNWCEIQYVHVTDQRRPMPLFLHFRHIIVEVFNSSQSSRKSLQLYRYDVSFVQLPRRIGLLCLSNKYIPLCSCPKRSKCRRNGLIGSSSRRLSSTPYSTCFSWTRGSLHVLDSSAVFVCLGVEVS